MHELNPKEAPFHALLAPLCLHQQKFLPSHHVCICLPGYPGNPKRKDDCICQGSSVLLWNDINPPREDQPCPLVKSVIELREEVKFYLSFTDKEVFEGVDLSEEDGDKPLASTTSATDTLGATVAESTLPNPKGNTSLCWVGYSLTSM